MAKINYKGWPNCYQLSNGVIDLIATTDVGPRIIRLGFVGEENMFKEFPAQVGTTGGDRFMLYGGHRLWHAPEVTPRTYQPDNAPVKLEEHSGFVRLIPPAETATGIQKEIDVYLDPTEAHVRVVHRLRNLNMWAIELAPWAISVMAPGGKAILPLPPRGSHSTDLLPTCSLSLWSYTNLSDPRWTWGYKYIMLRQDVNIATPQKIGVMDTDGWAAYANKGNLFVKTFTYIQGATYPDFGCSAESWTSNEMIELETLGPMVRLQPMTTVEHTENWFLFRNVPLPDNDADIDTYILPKVKTILSE